MSKHWSITLATMVFMSVAPAYAGQDEARSCAASLDANAKAIFDASLPAVAGGADLKSSVTSETKALVKAGKLARGDAKPAAQNAAECLKLAAG